MERESIILQGKKFIPERKMEIFLNEQKLFVNIQRYKYRSNNLTESLNERGQRTLLKGEKNNIRHGITVNFILDAFLYNNKNLKFQQ